MSDQSNVLFVLTDQWRAQSLGCAGNDDVRTPTVDRLAAEGARFERAYTPHPICSPARGSILTGQFAHRHGVVANTYNKLPLPTDIPTVADQLGDAGYRTGYIGKWHLDGGDFTGENELAVPPGRRGGFEYWEGFNTTGHDYWAGHPRIDGDDVRWEEGYQPAVQTDIALEFLEEHADAADPFFLFLSWGPPHPPGGGWTEMDPPDEYRELYDADSLEVRPNVPESGIVLHPERPTFGHDRVREHLADYYAYMTSLDDLLDRLLDGLEAAGVAGETVVVFTSDHGDMVGSQGEMRKSRAFEESINVPLVVRYPDGIAGGRRSEAVVSLVDLMPTLCSLGGADVPDRVQGHDLSPHLLQDGSDPHPSAGMAGESTRTADGSVYVEGRMHLDNAWRAVRTGDAMLAIDRNLETTHLYDTEADPYQQDNLAGEAPDLEEALREELFTRMDAADDREMIPRREHKQRHGKLG